MILNLGGRGLKVWGQKPSLFAGWFCPVLKVGHLIKSLLPLALCALRRGVRKRILGSKNLFGIY